MPSRSSDPRRAVRRNAAPVRFALALLLLLAAPILSSLIVVPTASASPATWYVEPQAPCVDQDVRLVFGICSCNTHWIGLTREANGLVRLDLSVDPSIVCIQCGPDSMSIALGRFAAGSYIQQIEIVSHIVGVTGSDSVKVESEQASFSVTATCSGLIPYLQSVRIGQPQPCEGCPQTACAGDSIPVQLNGMFTSPCFAVHEVRRVPAPVGSAVPAPDVIQLYYETCSNAPCAAVMTPWSAALPIGPLPTGAAYNLVVQGFLIDTCSPESLTFLGTHLEPFSVGGPCAVLPDSLPYVDNVFIGQNGPACSGDSIPVVVQGHFDNDCVHLDEVRLVPNPSMSPIPMPEYVQVIYRINSCLDIPCRTGFFPFAQSVRLSPLPANAYGLNVEAYLRDDCRPGELTPIGSIVRPFVVSDSCGTPTACFTAPFQHDGSGACDGYYGKNQPAEATLGLFATVPVSGLQGTLQFDRPGLRVSGIDALSGNALLTWQPTDTGAKFVIVSGQNGPLNRLPSIGQSTPLLTVRVEPLLRADAVPDEVRLLPTDLIASDPLGHIVPQCLIRANERWMDPAARFCRATACDFNGDLTTDVRDLVLMLRCMEDTLNLCTGIDRSQLDCNADGVRDIDDVLCCARVLLGQGMPDSTGGMPAPGVTLRFGAPATVAGGIDLPVTLTGSDMLGAARLAFDYPDAAFESASIELATPSSSWLALDQASGGHAVFGAIRLSRAMPMRDQTPDLSTLQLVLHLRTRAGQAVAGSVRYTGGDFSDPNGVGLLTAAGPVAMPLAGGPRIALGAARPNPFASETRFSVVLTQDSELDVAVYDLLGRKVATLFKGRATAGTRDFAWQRTRDDGAAVSSGVYFYRATANGEVASGKMLVLSRE